MTSSGPDHPRTRPGVPGASAPAAVPGGESGTTGSDDPAGAGAHRGTDGSEPGGTAPHGSGRRGTGLVLWHTAMSLDGFIAGPGNAMGWIFPHTGPNPEVDEVIATSGAILAGRNSYDAGRQPGQPPETRKPFGGGWTGRQFVLTHRPPDEPDPSVTFLTVPVTEAVATGIGAAGGKDLLVLGARTARQCLEAGLIDEILVHVVPVLLGQGTRLFERTGPLVDLETLHVGRAGAIANLRYRVPRP
jgi:dihydrofolate reductase